MKIHITCHNNINEKYLERRKIMFSHFQRTPTHPKQYELFSLLINLNNIKNNLLWDSKSNANNRQCQKVNCFLSLKLKCFFGLGCTVKKAQKTYVQFWFQNQHAQHLARAHIMASTKKKILSEYAETKIHNTIHKTFRAIWWQVKTDSVWMFFCWI